MLGGNYIAGYQLMNMYFTGMLEEHISKVHIRRCDICNVVFREQYLILEHFSTVHPEVLNFV